MLELDLLLGRFLEHGLDALDEAGQAAFQRLLDYPDTTLHALLMGDMQSADRELSHVIEAIRRARSAG
ncbi:MAG: succinate dehydrogenase assembly factor 2 [Gammaproteobacteria bacterium]|nr:MAG: succinate dehydrogenase assembly factor 2 [Gammaproteobacteria bacterium]